MSITNIDLSKYALVARYDLPEPTRTNAPTNSKLAQEASAVTYNVDTDTLFVVGDGGTSIVQVSKTGQLINSMTFEPLSRNAGSEITNGFYDPEGIAYIGNGQFVMTEERDRNAVLFTYTPNTTLTRAEAKIVKLGTTIGNIGLEGVTYDKPNGSFIFVKEETPQGIFQTTLNFNAGTASNGSSTTVNSTNLFDPALAGVLDFADVYALSNLAALSGQGDASHLLILSQASGKIVEVDRSGAIYSSLDIVSNPNVALPLADQQHEGLTVDKDGILYVVSEQGGGDVDHPQLWVYAPSAASNQAPTALALTNRMAAILENSSTTARIKVADVAITDDQIGTNVLSVSGADASYFEVDGTGLYLKAGTVIDYETKTQYSVTVAVDDTSVGATPDATASYTLNVTNIVDETPPVNVGPSLPALYISEVAPWSSGNSPVAADWFELTNSTSSAIDITGWKVDDNSNSFPSSVPISGVTSIAAGESVIFLEISSTTTLDALRTAFINTWFGGNAPAGLHIGGYSGSGVGLSTGGDAVNVYNAAGVLQASVSFGAAAAGPYKTFNNSIAKNNEAISALSTAGSNGAFAAANDSAEIGSPGSVGKVFISEVAPWSSSTAFKADWFEVTNGTAFAVDLTGWKMDDDSGASGAGAAVALNGVTSIAPGESVIFLESSDLAGARTAFINTWFGGIAPVGLQIGVYSGSGVGLSSAADAVYLFDASNALKASVTFGASSTGVFKTFDNSVALNSAAISQLSAPGVNKSVAAWKAADQIGSPGSSAITANVVDLQPTVTSDAAVSIAENSLTTAAVYTVTATDPDAGAALTYYISGGTDANLFNIDSSSGVVTFKTSPNFEVPTDAGANNVYDITVRAYDGALYADKAVTITVTDVLELVKLGKDFNGDGKGDILFQNSRDGAAYVWQMNGLNVVSSAQVGPAVGPDWQIKATGDFNRDGKTDFLFQNAKDGACYIWNMNGLTIASHGQVGPAVGTDWQIKATGDFNGDGKSDLLFQNAKDGACYIWNMNDLTIASHGQVGPAVGPDWQISATGDYNGDSKSDILFQNVKDGACYVWEMDALSLKTGGAGVVGLPTGGEWHALA